MALKMAAGKNTLKDLLTTGDTKYRPQDTPPYSDHSLSPEGSQPPSPDYFSNSKYDSEDDVSVSKGMLDSTRLTLCIFMLVMVTINPFNFLFSKYAGGQIGSADGFGKRMMLSCKYIFFISII